MSESVAPDVIAWLVTTWSGVLDIPVYDGPQAFDATDRKALLYVGHDPDDDGAAIRSEFEWSQIGLRRKDEVVEIANTIAVWTGDASVVPRRADALAYFEACASAHRSDISMGGLLIDSSITNYAMRQGQSELGAEVRIAFTVRARARI